MQRLDGTYTVFGEVIEGEQENYRTSLDYLKNIFHSVCNNPEQLKNVKSYDILGKVFSLMLQLKLTDDIDELRTITNIGYYFISKAIKLDNNNVNLFKDRVLLLQAGRNPLKYTLKSAFDKNIYLTPLMAFEDCGIHERDIVYKMEIADLELNPILHQSVAYFLECKEKFDEMISRQVFMPDKTKEDVIKSGLDYHNRLFTYLEDHIIIQSNINF